MPSVIAKLLLFVVVNASVLGYFEYRLPAPLGRKKDYWDACADRVQALALGSSQTAFGLAPEYLERPGFNLSYMSQDFYYESCLVDRYLERCGQLKLVLLEVTYVSFQYILDDSVEAYRGSLYHRLYEIPSQGGWLATDPKRLSFVGALGVRPALRYAQAGFRADKLPAPELLEPDGWEPQPCGREPLTPEEARRTMGKHQELMHPANVDTNLATCRKMIARLQARGVTVVLFTPPVTGDYRDCYLPAAQEQMQTCVRTLCDEFGLEYLDHGADPSFTAADFRDVNHLCRGGAVKFTRQLYAEICQRYPWWAN